MNIIKHESEFAGHKLALETGRLGHLSNAAVTVSYKDTVLLVTVNMSEKPTDGDFFPLMVDYREKYYASGKIRENKYQKREARPSDDSVLTMRVIDRAIRPLFPKYMRNEVQVVISVLSYDEETDPAMLGLLGVSAALNISGSPMEFPIAAARIARINDQLMVGVPPRQVQESGSLDLVLAGSMDAIMMVESRANELSEEQFIEAMEYGHSEIKKLVEFQNQFIEMAGKKEFQAGIVEPDQENQEKVMAFITDEMADNAILHADKEDLHKAMHDLEDKVLENFAEQIEAETMTEKEIMSVIDKVLGKRIRHQVLENQRRIDDRKLDEVREINVSLDLLPRAHGSATFARGITETLAVVTLGHLGESQVTEGMESEAKRRYMHHYNFYPYATGEARPIRFTSRREVGHSALAERALLAVLPPEEEFPYAIRVVNEITSCNGSSSMASVTGSSIALMAAGVPITKHVTGVAMGLVMDEESGKYEILADIQAQEDFNGDMDFKLARTKDGITALQLDIKIKGLKMELVKEILAKAKVACDVMEAKITETISEPRPKLSNWAPVIQSLEVDPAKIGMIIGPQGSVINDIIDRNDVKIDINDDGLVSVSSVGEEGGKNAIKEIKRIVYTPKVNDVIEGKVTRILDFGAIVEFAPKKDGMVHISQIKNERVEKVADELEVGQVVKVKVVETEPSGRTSLSMKQVKEDEPLTDI